MLGPDAIEKTTYVPPDKVNQSQKSEHGKQQKFARTLLEEQEQELDRRRRHVEDEVKLSVEEEEPQDTAEGKQEESGDAPTTSEEAADETAASQDDEGDAPSGDQHIDIKA